MLISARRAPQNCSRLDSSFLHQCIPIDRAVPKCLSSLATVCDVVIVCAHVLWFASVCVLSMRCVFACQHHTSGDCNVTTKVVWLWLGVLALVP